MKRQLLMAFFFCLFGGKMMAQDVIPLGLGWGDEQPILGGYPKAPTQIPSVSHDGRIIYFNSPHPDFTFLLIDENSEIVYETYVSASTTMIVLPSTFSGDFEIRLVTSSFYFYGYITL